MTVAELNARPLWANLYHRFPYVVKWKRHADPDFCEEKHDMVETDDVVEIKVDTSSNIIWVTTCKFAKDFKSKVQEVRHPLTMRDVIKTLCCPIYSGLTASEFVRKSFFASEYEFRYPEAYMKATVNPPKPIADSLVIFTIQIDDTWVIVYEDINGDNGTLPSTWVGCRTLRDFLCSNGWKELVTLLPNIAIEFWDGSIDKNGIRGLSTLDSSVHFIEISTARNACVIRTHSLKDHPISQYECADSLRLYLSKLGVFNGHGSASQNWLYYICPESKFGNPENWSLVGNQIPVDIMLRKVRYVVTMDINWITVYDDSEDANTEYEKIYEQYLSDNIIDGDTYIIHPNQKE